MKKDNHKEAKIIIVAVIILMTIVVSFILYKNQMEKMEREIAVAKAETEKAEREAIIAEQERVVAEEAQKLAEQAEQEAQRIASLEEKARKLAELEADKEEAARKLAEKKAADEKAARLAREKAEDRMNTDNDGDGLTYREELALGTSDWDMDSDDDGLFDTFDTNPTGGGRLIAQHFEWDYYGASYTWDYPIHSDWYDYYKSIPRKDHGADYVTYYDQYIIDIADKLLTIANKEGWCKSCFAVSFIQGLPYVKDAIIGYDDYPKYPLETFVERNGDCEDTSYLAASLIIAMNIDAALLLLPGHMAVGVWGTDDWTGTYYSKDGKNYYYYETTGEGWWFGEVPSEYKGVSATVITID